MKQLLPGDVPRLVQPERLQIIAFSLHTAEIQDSSWLQRDALVMHLHHPGVF